MNPTSNQKQFKRLKILGVVALCCTVLLWTALWAMSAIPSQQSSQSTNAVLNKLNKLFGLSQKLDGNVPTQSVDFAEFNKTLYNGKSYKMKVTFTPKTATDRELEFSSSDESVVKIDQNGVITGVSRGSVTITATLKSNPQRKTTLPVNCYGDDPETTDIVIRPETDIIVSKTVALLFNDGSASPFAPDEITSSDESVVNVWRGTAAGISPGTATLTAYYKDIGKTVSATVTVGENPSFVKPSSVVLKQNVTITHGKTLKISKLIEEVAPKSAASDFEIKCSGGILHATQTSLKALQPGKTTVTFVSRYDKSVTATTEITVSHVTPTALEIVTSSNKFSPNTEYTFWARHTPRPYWYDAKWEVVSGKGKITEDGVFKTKFFGKTVVRCTSTIDPTLTAEFEVNTGLFEDAYSFTRKLVGHMGLSAILGFGIFGTTFLLTKRKRMCAVLTPALSFTYAGISELIQKFTPGRFCTLSDVLIDFLGAMTGAVFGLLLVAIVCLIWRLFSKESFSRLVSAYKALNLKTAFKKLNHTAE